MGILVPPQMHRIATVEPSPVEWAQRLIQGLKLPFCLTSVCRTRPCHQRVLRGLTLLFGLHEPEAQSPLPHRNQGTSDCLCGNDI